MRAAFACGVLVFAAVAYGCPQSLSTADGEALDAAANDDAGLNGTGDAGARGDAADMTSDAGSQSIDATINDAESTDRGGAPLAALRWGQMTLPPNTNIVKCIWGRSSSEIYAGTGTGKLLRFTPSEGWISVWQEPNNFGIHAIWGTANKLFVAGETSLYVHTGGIESSPPRYGVGRWIYDMHGVSETEVYLVSDQQNGRGFYLFDGSQIMTLSEPSDVGTLASVFAQPGGPVWVGGNGALFEYSARTLTRANVEWPPSWSQTDTLYFTFYAIGAVGSRLFAMGDRFLIFERQQDAVWRLVHSPFLTEDLHGLAGFERGDDTEIWAVGGNGSDGPIVRWYKGQWLPDQYSSNVNLLEIWAAGPDEYYAAGHVENTFDGVILRGVR